MIRRLQRVMTGPVLVTAALVVLAAPVAGAGWLLTWLLLGLTAGYALSGSA